jgi:hypothetical protein
MNGGRWLMFTVGLLPLLVGCGGGDSGNNDLNLTETAQAQIQVDATQTASSVTPTPLPPMDIGAIVWASEIDADLGTPTETVDSFSSEDRTIYAVVPVSNVPENTVISAAWSYNNTSLDALLTTVTIATGQHAEWIEFHLTRSDDLWPDGEYAIAISVDGEVAQQADVTVENQ